VITELQTKASSEHRRAERRRESGKGGELFAAARFPVRLAQGSGANMAISVLVQGIRRAPELSPVIHGDSGDLKVRRPGSTLDSPTACCLQGFRIPALSTRRTETEVDCAGRTRSRSPAHQQHDELDAADDTRHSATSRFWLDVKSKVGEQGFRPSWS